MWMKVICLRPFILCIVIGIFVSQADAQSYKCELRPNGYAAAFTSLNQNLSRKVQEDFLVSISPISFEVNENFVKKLATPNKLKFPVVIEKKVFM